MAKVVIPTACLDLTLQSPDEALAWVESLPPTDREEVSPDWIARIRATDEVDYWSLTFTAVDRATGETVGACGFKGHPDSDGVVELAYGIDLLDRGRGFATEAAGALASFALASDRVRVVRAHTKPDNGASVRFLVKCGFRPVGEVVDPEDGLVHRRELERSEPTVGVGMRFFRYTFFDLADVSIPGAVAIPEGKITLETEFTPDGSKEGGGTLRLFVNGQPAGEGKLKRTSFRHGLEPFEIGRDSVTPVDPAYKDKGVLPFTGRIDRVTFELTR